jgi:fatty-acyl-CoA synthase
MHGLMQDRPLLISSLIEHAEQNHPDVEIISRRLEGPILDGEGYFDTGDIATIDPDGYMQIMDRAKDVIKSGGEWISSIEIEAATMAHPDVAEAAVIGLPHPKWQERPLLVVVKKEGREVTGDGILAFVQGKVPRWGLPDEVAFVDQLPHTATGKLLKTRLRELFAGHALPASTQPSR